MSFERPREFVSKLEDIIKAKELVFPAAPGFGPYKRFFPKASVSHPAKASTFLLEYLIERYTKPGDTVADPMAGTFSTVLVASLKGRNAVGVELEEKFYEWANGADCDGYSCHALGCVERRSLEAKVRRLTRELRGTDYTDVTSRLVWAEETRVDEVNTPKDALELYRKFQALKEAKEALKKLPRKPHHFVGMKEMVGEHGTLCSRGSMTLIRGDARNLSKLLWGADVALTSPPYSDSISQKSGSRGGHPEDWTV